MTADRSVTASFNLNIPPVPTGVSCSTASASQINVSWNASSGADDYLVYRCTGDGCTPTSNTYTTSSTSWSNTGLSAGTVYRYRVRARNAVGTSGYSSTVTCITVPATPSGLSCATASPSQINVSWNSVTGASDYLVYRCTGSTCTPSTLVRTQSSTSWSNTGLSANTTYRYRVRAQNSGGTSSYSSIATCTTAASNYSLVVNKDGTGSGTVTSNPSGISCGSTCSTNFSYGTSVTLSASAASGSVFTGWSGACSGTGTCTVSMTANRSVTASFTITTYTLAGTISGSGTVNVNPPNTNYSSNFQRTYNYGTSVTLSATAGTGYAFAGWSGACSGTGTCTVSMTDNRSVTASFTITTRTLTVAIPPGCAGRVIVEPPDESYRSDFQLTYDYGTSVTLSPVVTRSECMFEEWSGDCSGTGTCTVSMTADRSVTAWFTFKPECFSDNDCPDCTESGWCPDGSACTATFYGVCTDGECTCGLMYTHNCPPYCVLP